MMTRQDQDEFSKAFNAPTDDAPEGAESESASVTLNEDPDVPVGDPVATGEVPAEEVPDEEVSAEPAAKPADSEETWEQRYKTLQGKYKSEVPAMLERIRALEARRNETPQTLAEGGEVMGGGVPGAADVPASEEEKKKLGLKEKYEQAMSKTPDGMVFNAVRDMLADGGQPGKLDEGAGDGTVTLPDAEAYADGGEVDSLESIKAEAMELAKSPEKLAAAIKTMIADYGRRFVVVATAAPMILVDSRAEEFAGQFDSALSELAEEVKEAFSAIHRDRIEEGHEDYQDLYDSLVEWVGSMSEEEKHRAQAIIDGGMPSKIKRLYSDFKKAKQEAEAPKERTPEDVWAEDAASSVRSSAPLKIPTRAPESESDEYKRAFDEA